MHVPSAPQKLPGRHWLFPVHEAPSRYPQLLSVPQTPLTHMEAALSSVHGPSPFVCCTTQVLLVLQYFPLPQSASVAQVPSMRHVPFVLHSPERQVVPALSQDPPLAYPQRLSLSQTPDVHMESFVHDSPFATVGAQY